MARARKRTALGKARARITWLKQANAVKQTQLEEALARLAQVAEAIHVLLNCAHDHQTGEEMPF